MKSLFSMLCGLAALYLFNLSCASRKQKLTPPETAAQASVTTKLLDMFVIYDKYIVPNHPGFLQPNSKAWGADIQLAGKKFTIGFVDYNGDGRFDDTGNDLLIITVFRNRKISINNHYGTHRIPIKNKKHFLQVDSTMFTVTVPGDDKIINIAVAGKKENEDGEVLKLLTHVPNAELYTLDDTKVQMSKYLGQQKYTLLFFWALRPFPETLENSAQVKYLDKLIAYHAKKLNVVGLRVMMGEPFNLSNPVFLKEMQESPWDNLITTEEFYDDMQQDLSYFKGVLAAPDGEILEVDITPRELLDRLESGVY